MDMVNNILLFLHFGGLIAGMGSGIAMSRVGPALATANADQRKALFTLGGQLLRTAHIGLAVLWITGPLLIWLKFGGIGGLDAWFWAKIVFVIILSASIGIASAAFRKLAAGDASQAPRMKTAGMVNGLTGIAIVLCAVFAFN